MAVSASAFGAHVVRSLDDMLRGPLRKAGAELRADAESLLGNLKLELQYAEDAENQVLEEDRAREWLAELRRVLYRADQLLQAYGADAHDQRPSSIFFLPVRLYAFPFFNLFWDLPLCFFLLTSKLIRALQRD